MDILTKIVNKKQQRIAAAKKSMPLTTLQELCVPNAAGRFSSALSRPNQVNIIAEVKKASPSKGVIREDFDPLTIAREYTEGGAVAISVLTEEDFFQGSLEILRNIRSITELPLLRKDFIVDEYQIYEAAYAGADAFLLIASLLEVEQMRAFAALGTELGLDALVEVHTAQELEKVLNCSPSIIGVNNRNLKTFEVNLKTSIDLATQTPKETILVSESGINSSADIQYLRQAGYQAFLVGEQLMRAASPGQALAELLAERVP